MAGRKRGSVSGLSARCFGERQKRWGKVSSSFSPYLPFTPLQTLSHCCCSDRITVIHPLYFLFTLKVISQSFILPPASSHTSPPASPELLKGNNRSMDTAAQTWTQRSQSVFGPRRCLSESASSYNATLWTVKRAWLRHTCT